MARKRRDPRNPLVMKNFLAPSTLLAKLQESSDTEGVSESEIIRKALELYMEDPDGAAPSATD